MGRRQILRSRYVEDKEKRTCFPQSFGVSFPMDLIPFTAPTLTIWPLRLLRMSSSSCATTSAALVADASAEHGHVAQESATSGRQAWLKKEIPQFRR